MIHRVACSLLTLAVVGGLSHADEPREDAAKSPQWRRILKGDDAARAESLEKRIAQLKDEDRSEAIKQAEELLALRARLQGEDHWQVREARNTLEFLRRPAFTAEQRERLKEADRLAQEGVELSTAGRHQEAAKPTEECLRIRREILGDTHPDTALALFNLALLYKSLGRVADAVPLDREALRIRRAILGELHPSTAWSLNNLAVLHYLQGNFSEAEPLYVQALRIRREVLGDKDPATAVSVNNLAALYKAQGKYADAEPLYVEALRTRREILGDKHPAVALSLNNLAGLYQAQAKYSAAESLYNDVVRIRREVLGPNHPDTAISLNNLAVLYESQAKYAEAEPLFREALRVFRDAPNQYQPNFASTLNNLALLLYSQGKYSEAESLYSEALRIFTRTLGGNHPNTALSLSGLAVVYDSQGKRTEAEPLYREALRISRETLGDNHPNTANSLQNLAELYRAQAKYAQAEPLYRQALRIRTQVLGEKHPSTADCQTGLAWVCVDQSKFDEAEPLLLQALRTSREARGENHPDTANILNALGKLALNQAKFTEAEKHFSEALRIHETVLGENHEKTATSLYNLALVDHSQGKLDQAETLYKRSLSNTRRILGVTHNDTAMTLNGLAYLYQSQGKSEEAERVLRECTISYEASRLRRARSVERGIGGEGSNPYPLLAAVAASKGKAIEAFLALEHNLARGLFDELSQRQGAKLSPEQESKRKTATDRIGAIEPRILKLASQPKLSEPEQKELDALIDERRTLDDALASLAADLSQREVAEFETIRSAIPADAALVLWINMRSGNGSVQEHWVCVVRSTGDPRWARLPGTGPSGAWTLADTQLPDRLIAALARSASAAEVESLASQLRAQRIAPILPYLEGTTRLLVVPVLHMAGVPVELLTSNFTVSYVPSGTFLARLKDQGLPTSQRLLALGDPVFTRPDATPTIMKPPPGGLLITRVLPDGAAAKARLQPGDVLLKYGDVELANLDQLKAAVAAKSQAASITLTVWRENVEQPITCQIAQGRLGVVLDTSPAPAAIAARRTTQQILAARSRAGGGDWRDLPGTRIETNRLRQIFGEQAELLTDSDASEQMLEKLRRSGELAHYRYLHFATHGEGNSTRAFESALILAQDRLPPEKDALPKSGEPYLDGQLSASEVLDYWKLNAELVTLSGCETALGKQGGGDGLLGFAQAFLTAGSRSVCLSLWKVDDAATALLMSRFYENLLGRRDGLAQPMDKAAALDEAKHWLRRLSSEQALALASKLGDGVARGTRGKGEALKLAVPNPNAVPRPSNSQSPKPFEHPRYWAGFILIGDPG